MHNRLNRNQTAKYTLLLVMLVIFVCSGQNFGLVTSCNVYGADNAQSTDSYFNTPALSAEIQRSLDSQSSENTDKCSLSDHLLQLHQHTFEHAIISLFIIVLTFSVFAGVSRIVPVLTEPIPPTRRRHLTFCVFRE
ncbi:hypothetical protein [Photobacterium minamisatsumaniensis]|uniref:hypothetical protein n=1 Tax=Photobacterium minamisatsumaniensis TaxID=2910233 RepID=UPI003D148ACD